MRELYGHEFAPTVAKVYCELPSSTLPVGAYLYHPLGSLLPYVTDALVPLAAWHDPILSPPSTGLELLRSNPNVGFLLLAGRHWDATSCTFGAHILRILAAPSLPPLLPSADVSGIHIPLLWSTRPPFIADVDYFLPLLAAGAGFSRSPSAGWSGADILRETGPVVCPFASHLSAYLNGLPLCWFLPLGCSAPVGLTWSLTGSHTLTLATLGASISLAHRASGTRFITALIPIQPALDR